MLHAFMACSEKVAIHAGRRAALLDELELHVTRVGQRNRDVNAIVARTAIAELCERELVSVEPGTHTADLNPMLHGGFDVAHNDTDLAQLAEKATHRYFLR